MQPVFYLGLAALLLLLKKPAPPVVGPTLTPPSALPKKTAPSKPKAKPSPKPKPKPAPVAPKPKPAPPKPTAKPLSTITEKDRQNAAGGAFTDAMKNGATQAQARSAALIMYRKLGGKDPAFVSKISRWIFD